MPSIPFLRSAPASVTQPAPTRITRAEAAAHKAAMDAAHAWTAEERRALVDARQRRDDAMAELNRVVVAAASPVHNGRNPNAATQLARDPHSITREEGLTRQAATDATTACAVIENRLHRTRAGRIADVKQEWQALCDERARNRWVTGEPSVVRIDDGERIQEYRSR